MALNQSNTQSNHQGGIPVLVNLTNTNNTREPSPTPVKYTTNSIFKTPDTRQSRNNDGRLVRSSTVGSGSKSPIRRHLRTMSITSNSSPAFSSNSNSARKGINIGVVAPISTTKSTSISSAPSVNNNGNREKDSESKTPRRKLFVRKETNPERLSMSPPLGEFANQQLEETDKRSSIDTNNTDMSSIMNTSPTPSTKNINEPHDELSENFRLLASKEMEVLDIKNQLKDLLQKKKDKEFELQQLKVKIEQQLMSNLKQQNNEQYKHRFDQHIPKSPNSLHKSVVQPSTSTIDPLLDDTFTPVLNHAQPYEEDNRRQSWFAKPLNFIQQFDNMIYKEFEKLQMTDDDYEELHSKDPDFVDMNREVNSKTQQNAETFTTGGDVMQSVSQHLWSFVNDVKSNLLIEEEEPTSPPLQPTNIIVTKSPSRSLNLQQSRSPHKEKLRTASISKRQSYSQHNLHKKRPSMNMVKPDKNEFEKQDISDQFTKSGINDVVRSLSKNEPMDSRSGSSSATEMKSNLTSGLLDKDNYDIEDSDLWDSEPLDI